MKLFRQIVSVSLIVSLAWFAEATTFDKIRYNGGTVNTNVDPKDWDNQLTVASDRIVLALKDGQSVKIDPALVTGLSYGQEAHRRVGTMIALGILVAPLALFGLFHKTRLHYIGIEYRTPDGKNAGLLVQAHKDNYRGVLQALRGATQAPISVAPEDRKYIASAVGEGSLQSAPAEAPAPPAGAAPAPTPAAIPGTAPAPAPPAAPAPPDKGTINLTSNPVGASIFINESFAGQTPAKLRLSPRKVRLRLFLQGYKEWAQEIEIFEGSEVNLQIELQK
jgi:hypothetical protein